MDADERLHLPTTGTDESLPTAATLTPTDANTDADEAATREHAHSTADATRRRSTSTGTSTNDHVDNSSTSMTRQNAPAILRTSLSSSTGMHMSTGSGVSSSTTGTMTAPSAGSTMTAPPSSAGLVSAPSSSAGLVSAPPFMSASVAQTTVTPAPVTAAPTTTATVSNRDDDDDDVDDEHRIIKTDPSGRYECYAKTLGMGAYKRVHLAFDQEEGVEVAWNELRLDHLQKKDAMKILSEVQILQQLRHDSIINFFDSWVSKNQAGREQIYFITELMTSGTLKSYIRKTKGPIKPKVLRNWCRQVLKGLVYLHTRDPPVIHRDLKCENIFINGNNGQAKIGDLGLATLKSREHMSSVLGTPEFMAPELYEERYDEKVDIYAFGMCVLEMVTKEYPYNECTNQAQIYRKVSSNIKPKSLETISDPAVREFIEICIDHDPLKRPSAAQLLEHPFIASDVVMMGGGMGTSATTQGDIVSPTMAYEQRLSVDAGQASPLPDAPVLNVDEAPRRLSVGARSTTLTTPTLDGEPAMVVPVSPSLDANALAAVQQQHPHAIDQDLPIGEQALCAVEVLGVAGNVITIKMICLSPERMDMAEDTAHSGDDAHQPSAPLPKQEVKFPFSYDEDTPEAVIDEMVREGVLREQDRRLAVENLLRAVRSVLNILNMVNTQQQPQQQVDARPMGDQQAANVDDVESDTHMAMTTPESVDSTPTGSPSPFSWRRPSLGSLIERSDEALVRKRSRSSDFPLLNAPAVATSALSDTERVRRRRSRSSSSISRRLYMRGDQSPRSPLWDTLVTAGLTPIDVPMGGGRPVSAPVPTQSPPLLYADVVARGDAHAEEAVRATVVPATIPIRTNSPRRVPTTASFAPSVDDESPARSFVTGDLSRPDTAVTTSSLEVATPAEEQQPASVTSPAIAVVPTTTAAQPPSVSHYHKALEEKTNEITEGVYRSQFRRGASITSTTSASSVTSGLPLSTAGTVAVAATSAPTRSSMDTKAALHESQSAPMPSAIATAAQANVVPIVTRVHGYPRIGSIPPVLGGTTSVATALMTPTTAVSGESPTMRWSYDLSTMIAAKSDANKPDVMSPLTTVQGSVQAELGSTGAVSDEKKSSPVSTSSSAQSTTRSISEEAERQLLALQSLALSGFDAEVTKKGRALSVATPSGLSISASNVVSGAGGTAAMAGTPTASAGSSGSFSGGSFAAGARTTASSMNAERRPNLPQMVATGGIQPIPPPPSSTTPTMTTHQPPLTPLEASPDARSRSGSISNGRSDQRSTSMSLSRTGPLEQSLVEARLVGEMSASAPGTRPSSYAEDKGVLEGSMSLPASPALVAHAPAASGVITTSSIVASVGAAAEAVRLPAPSLIDNANVTAARTDDAGNTQNNDDKNSATTSAVAQTHASQHPMV